MCHSENQSGSEYESVTCFWCMYVWVIAEVSVYYSTCVWVCNAFPKSVSF
jgi:hypothetical protein